MKRTKTYQLALAGMLIAVGIIIPTFSPIKIIIEPASFTLASHVPVFLAMFISPAMGVAVSLEQHWDFSSEDFRLLLFCAR